MRPIVRLTIATAAALMFGACGRDARATTQSPSSSVPTARRSETSVPNDVANLVGLPVSEAKAQVEAMGLFARVLAKGQPVTLEEDPGRVNLRVEDGKVMDAWRG